MAIPASLVKELREKSGAGMMDCKAALEETGADLEKAVDYLRQKGLADAGKKAGRSATEGLVYSYIHAGGKIGVLLEVNCETDFVARTPQFQEFVKDVAMHVAASNTESEGSTRHRPRKRANPKTSSRKSSMGKFPNSTRIMCCSSKHS
jgi:elongation factor Ts